MRSVTGESLAVGLVTSEFPPDLGGVETYAWQLAAELGRREGLDVTVYAPPSAARVSPPPGVRVRACLTSCRARDWPRLRKDPIDVWHALSAPHAWLALTGRPTVVSVHGNDFLAPYALTARPALSHRIPGAMQAWLWRRFKSYWRARTRALLARSLPLSSAILSNSRYTAEVLAREIPATAPRLQLAGVGVDAAFFDIPRAARGEYPRLLTVSRLSEPRKNVGLVLRALGRLATQHRFNYTIAGDGSNRQDLESLATTLGIADRVRFTGRVDDDTLRGLYGSADLFVLASSVIPGSHEGFGIVYLEAAAAGVPSLAAHVAGAVEAVSEGRSGYFVKDPTVDALEAALRQFLDRGIAFDELACREFARQFTWARVADLAVAAYRSALRAPASDTGWSTGVDRPSSPEH